MGSPNNCPLKSANYCRLTGVSLLFFFLSSFQNSAGLYFNISGSCCEYAHFALLHAPRNTLYAVLASSLCLPAAWHVARCAALAWRQESSNQGARCFPKRLGLSGALIWYALITPAASPACKRYYSMAVVRSSLLRVLSATIFSIPVLNSTVSEWLFHAAIPSTCPYNVLPTSQRYPIAAAGAVVLPRGSGGCTATGRVRCSKVWSVMPARVMSSYWTTWRPSWLQK